MLHRDSLNLKGKHSLVNIFANSMKWGMELRMKTLFSSHKGVYSLKRRRLTVGKIPIINLRKNIFIKTIDTKRCVELLTAFDVYNIVNSMKIRCWFIQNKISYLRICVWKIYRLENGQSIKTLNYSIVTLYRVTTGSALFPCEHVLPHTLPYRIKLQISSKYYGTADSFLYFHIPYSNLNSYLSRHKIRIGCKYSNLRNTFD